MNRSFAAILLFLICVTTSAAEPDEEKRCNLLSFRQLEFGSPWLQSKNAAGLSQMLQLFPAELKLGFSLNDGGFHSVFKGKSDQSFDLGSQSFRKINKTYLFGSFNYSKSYEKGLNFSNTNDPAMNYPYLLADTIGNDTYDREFFKLTGIISSPLNSQLDWGLSFDYKVGTASQNRDPRPENKVLQTNISPGLLFKTRHFKLGANLAYGYYNEDIDISVVQENAQHTMFQLHGPGVFSYHASSSFYRLYQQHRFGGGMQFEWMSGNVSNLLHSDYSYSVQTIDDGRRGSNATWAAVKNDSRLDRIDWNLTDVISFDKGGKVHQLKAMLHIVNKLGTEFIQRLEKVSATDLEHWITYGEEQKYYSLRTNAELNYQLLVKDEDNLMKSLFNAGLKYSAFAERYYLPNNHQDYSNLRFAASYLKLFTFPQASVSTEMKFSYQFNLDGKQNLVGTNFLVEKMYGPEFNYLIEGFLSPGVSLAFQVPLQKTFDKYFIKTDFDWYHSESGLTRTVFSFSTGLIF
ncbi:MAG: hypothetical protein Q8T04_09895 [Bacteroidota bacterium]|nr:hypothetical protein [Bacteroidota bacterium]